MSDVAQLNYIVSNHGTLGGMLYESRPVSHDEYYRAYRIASDLFDYDTSSTGSTDVYVYLPKLDMVISPRGYFTTANYQMAQRPRLDTGYRRLARLLRRRHRTAFSPFAEHDPGRRRARHGGDGHPVAGVAAHRHARMAGWSFTSSATCSGGSSRRPPGRPTRCSSSTTPSWASSPRPTTWSTSPRSRQAGARVLETGLLDRVTLGRDDLRRQGGGRPTWSTCTTFPWFRAACTRSGSPACTGTRSWRWPCA